MSPFIRRYAKYLGEKSTAYRGTAMDFCKVKRGSVRIFLEKHRETRNIIQERRRSSADNERRQTSQNSATAPEPGGRSAGV